MKPSHSCLWVLVLVCSPLHAGCALSFEPRDAGTGGRVDASMDSAIGSMDSGGGTTDALVSPDALVTDARPSPTDTSTPDARTLDAERDAGAPDAFMPLDASTYPDGLVSWFPFDSRSTFQVDVVGGHNATCTVCPTWNAMGRHGGAAVFSSTMQYFEVAGGTDFVFTDGLTVAAFVNVTRHGSQQTVVSIPFASGIHNSVSVALNATGTAFVYAGTISGGFRVNGTTVLPLGTWTHLAATWDTGMLRLYVNGEVEGERALPMLTFDMTPALFGIDRDDGALIADLDALVDDVQFYRRPLGTIELRTLATE